MAFVLGLQTIVPATPSSAHFLCQLRDFTVGKFVPETREERDKATDCVTQPHRFSSLNKTLNKRICEGA